MRLILETCALWYARKLYRVREARALAKHQHEMNMVAASMGRARLY